MKYTIAFTEEIPHIETVSAPDEKEAIKELWKLIQQKDLYNNGKIVDIRDEDGNAWAFIDYVLTQYRFASDRR